MKISPRSPVLAAVAAGALALPAAAGAHVTLHPESAAAGSYTELVVRVPNEEDNAATTKVDVQLPAAFDSVSYQPVPGWSTKVSGREIVWTADGGSSAGIAPGQFVDFPISVKIPDQAGTALTFKALQTYSGGEVVRWIGPEGSEHPAPQVQVTAASAGSSSAPSSPSPASSASADDGGSSNGLAIAGIVLGALGLLVGGAAFATRRRTAVR